ncbi:hypothetical protein LPJ66_003719 [Kickxella alabastrina]|uniref:Uncharacterized protein n=1 Tax=Kickxella alabastrina TaxID=61397 RepID=A0ACC1IMV7_9FUNG|nr:hypothetical protein LPJ66_003719 [Kickxella alabastrina]
MAMDLGMIVDLVMQLCQNREIEVVTANGAPVPFMQQYGLVQGDVLSPLLWIAVYDPLLTQVCQECILCPEELGIEAVRILAVAYADDLTLMGSSHAELQETMNLTMAWFNMVGVKVNSSKIELIEWPQQEL